MFDIHELEQAQYQLAQHYLTRLKTYARLYETQNQAHIAAQHFENDWSQIEHSANWAVQLGTEQGAELYLAFVDAFGFLLDDRQDFSHRLSQLTTALQIAQQLDRKPLIAHQLFRLGSLHRVFANNEEAQDYVYQALPLALELGNQRLVANCYHELGIITKRLGQQNDAWNYMQQALDVARAMGSDADIAKYLNALSKIAYEKGELDQAIELARESLVIYETIGSARDIAQVTYTIGSLLLMSPDSPLDEGREILWRSYTLFGQIGNKRMEASAACALVVDLINNQGDYATAIQLAEAALDTCRALNEPHGICDALTYLGEAALHLGDYQRAQECFEEGLVLARATNSVWSIIELLCGLGKAANQAERFDDARDYLLEALQVAAKADMVGLMLFTLAHLAIPIAYQSEQVEYAVELIGLAINHPLTTRSVIKDAQAVLAQLQSEFTSYDLALALERGKESDLSKVTDDLLQS